MALTGLHTNFLNGSYAGDREYILRAEENTDLFNGKNVARELRPDFDGNNSLAIGYGLDLLVNNDATINSYLTAAGLPQLTAQDMTVLAQARAYRSSQLANKQPVDSLRMDGFSDQLSLDLQTRRQKGDRLPCLGYVGTAAWAPICPRGMRGITYETTRRGERPKQGSLSPFSGPTSGGSDFLDGGEGDELQLERMVA